MFYCSSFVIIKKTAGTTCPLPGQIDHGEWDCKIQQMEIPDADDFQTYPGVDTHHGVNDYQK